MHWRYITSPLVTMPEVDADALIMDGAAIVHMLPPRNCTIFSEYSRDVFLPFLERILVGTNFHLDIVFGVYRPGSLKFSVSEVRGQELLGLDTPVPNNWNGFFRNEANNTEIFDLADEISTISIPWLVVAMNGSAIFSKFLKQGMYHLRKHQNIHIWRRRIFQTSSVHF